MRLVLLSGPRAGETIEIEGEQIIGRGEVDIVIEDPKLSRRHTAVRALPDGLEIEDLGSLNGTEVNGQRIGQPVRLHGGERVRLCSTTLEVTADAPQSQPTALEQAPALSVPAAGPAASVLTPPGAQPPAPAAPFATARPGAAPARAARGPRPAASLLWGPTLLSVLIVVAVAIAEVAYFASR